MSNDAQMERMWLLFKLTRPDTQHLSSHAGLVVNSAALNSIMGNNNQLEDLFLALATLCKPSATAPTTSR